ncbi:MAG: hypothetical protein HOQ24_17675 [Mycobacteriaceae bacterium]|nr:hypothetical protein [Mycobacteriaceae bacterium]
MTTAAVAVAPEAAGAEPVPAAAGPSVSIAESPVAQEILDTIGQLFPIGSLSASPRVPRYPRYPRYPQPRQCFRAPCPAW